MKRIYLNIIGIGLVFIALGAISCTKQLEKHPYDAIDLSQSFQSVKDAKSWDNGFYAKLRANVYGIFTYSTDVQADELNATLEYGNRNGFPHRWEGFLSTDYTIRDVWRGYYNAIANINVAIDGFAGITPDGDDEKAELDQYLGDAYFGRAYYYSRLILRFAKPYEPSTASTDLGVPLLTKYDLEGMPARATVKEVYDQILSDLAKAKSLLGGVKLQPGSTRFNNDVVSALEARVKLHMQDWEGAASAAKSLIDGGKYKLIDNAADLKKMWTNDLPQETIFQCFLSQDELANTNAIYLGYQPDDNKYRPDFIPSQWVVDAYSDNDIRKGVYFLKDSVIIIGKTYTDIYLVNKFPGNPEYFTSASTNYENAPKIFRIAEMYLILAEAQYHTSPISALVTLNALRQARGLAPSIGLSGDNLFQAIKDERFKELAFEGFRLDDLKRWHEGFTRHDPQNTKIINTGENFDSKTVAPDADKFVWGIPSNDITVNPNLKGEQNPGW